MRLTRIDDFPHGDKSMMDSTYRQRVEKALSIFERNQVPYILGCSPLLLLEGDVEFLNNLVKVGFVVMHGFDHGWSYEPWSNVTSIWSFGGEFWDKNPAEIESLYDKSKEILSKINKFSPDHFVPPFNCFNQSLIDVLNKKGVKYLHTCDKEYVEYRQFLLEYGDLKVFVSEFKKTYDYAAYVLNHLKNPSQITLHWCYDQCNDPNWEEHYQRLCDEIKNEK